MCPLAGNNFDLSILPIVDDYPFPVAGPTVVWHAGTPLVCSGSNEEINELTPTCFRLDWVKNRVSNALLNILKHKK